MNNMKKIVIEQNVSKSFRDYRNRKLLALHKINLDIMEGEFFVLLGPSGCGKSTLLRIMSGLDKKYTGTQQYGEGVDKNAFGFVFQQSALLPWLTVEQNISLGLVARGTWGIEEKRKVSELLRKFGLERFAHQHPKDLSGGMKQRIGIARALAIDPQVIFLDEPFSALDSFTAKTLRKELLDLWHERKITIVMVTHNIEEAVELADRIGVMSPRPGELIHITENKLVRPRELRSKEFFEMVDMLTSLIKIS
jgi:ABC-type nitrate/sulfonate/bicarbonate transport system ATPase subunit